VAVAYAAPLRCRLNRPGFGALSRAGIAVRMRANFNLQETLSRGLHARAGRVCRQLRKLPSQKAFGAWQGQETVNIPGVAWLVALR
jgi:hypothetical protein